MGFRKGDEVELTGVMWPDQMRGLVVELESDLGDFEWDGENWFVLPGIFKSDKEFGAELKYRPPREGDTVRLTGPGWGKSHKRWSVITLKCEDGELYHEIEGRKWIVEPRPEQYWGCEVVTDPSDTYTGYKISELPETARESLKLAKNVEFSISTPVDPDHYKFPGGAEVRRISEWLTCNIGQAVQYLARSSRIDGNNKGDAREDLEKARRFIDFELERLEGTE